MMMGLVLKDLYALKGYGRIMALLCVLYIGVSAFTGSLAMAVGVMLVLCAMVPMSSIALDEQARWDAYACALPLRKRDVMLGKYLLVVTLMIACGIILLAAGGLIQLFRPIDWQELLLSVAIIGCLSLLMNGLTFPLLVKFGPEKARLLIVIVMMAMTLAFTQVEAAQRIFQAAQNVPLWLVPIAVSAVYVASYFISAGIYEKKEF